MSGLNGGGLLRFEVVENKLETWPSWDGPSEIYRSASMEKRIFGSLFDGDAFTPNTSLAAIYPVFVDSMRISIRATSQCVRRFFELVYG